MRFLQCFHNDRREHMQLALLRANDCPNTVPPLLSAAHDTYFALDIRPQIANAKSIGARCQPQRIRCPTAP